MSRRTIQSPGVEIREIDLTQRPAEPVGTSVFIPGFSNQGPTDEILNVGTFADFEDIYGKPTNAAERYFYHSVRQTFNSDANVYVSRLPYGASDGTTTTKYTALVYPVNTPNVKNFTIHNDVEGIRLDFKSGDLAEYGFRATGTASDAVEGFSLSYEITTKNTTTGIISFSTGTIGSLSAHTDSLSSLSGGATLNQAFSSLSGADIEIIKALGWTTYDTVTAFTDSNDLNLSAADYYIFGNPTLVELTPSEYNKLNSGEFSWDRKARTGVEKDYSGSTLLQNASAGMIILNSARTSINNSFEGYYVGIIDGVNLNPARFRWRC